MRHSTTRLLIATSRSITYRDYNNPFHREQCSSIQPYVCRYRQRVLVESHSNRLSLITYLLSSPFFLPNAAMERHQRTWSLNSSSPRTSALVQRRRHHCLSVVHGCQPSLISDHRCSYLGRSAAPHHVRTISASFL